MTFIDWLAVAIIGGSALLGLIRGFVREVLSLGTWILALFIAIRFGSVAAGSLPAMIEGVQLRTMVALAILFFATLLIGSLLSVGLARMIHYSPTLRGTDRSLGLALGLLRGVVVVGLIALIIRATPYQDHPAYSGAVLRPGYERAADLLYRFLPAEYREYFSGTALPGDRPQEGER